jgi:methionine-R-sulfoxide reductase
MEIQMSFKSSKIISNTCLFLALSSSVLMAQDSNKKQAQNTADHQAQSAQIARQKEELSRQEALKKALQMPEKKKQKLLKELLTPQQYHVTQENGTEPANDNAYFDNKAEGIYVDVISGEPLFSSTHKYDSCTGWPSFYDTIKKESIEEKKDHSHGMERVEVRSTTSDSHLGHLFTDGPNPTGLRYCMNSSALRFVPKAEMANQGYGDYLYLFEGSK